MIQLLNAKPYDEIKFDLALTDLRIEVEGENPFQRILWEYKYGKKE